MMALLGDTTNNWEGDIAIDNISVIDALNDDLAVTNVALANNDCDLTASEIITATVFNNGANSVTAFDISYTVNGGTAVTETVTGLLNSNTDTTYVFTTTADMSADGIYDVEV